MRSAFVCVCCCSCAFAVPLSLVSVEGEGFALEGNVLRLDPMTWDANALLEEEEAADCALLTSPDCEVIRALDRSDDGAVSTPPRIPATFPKSVVVNGAPLDVDAWARDEGLLGEGLQALAAIDLRGVTGEEGAGVDVDVAAITLVVQRNTLNVAVPAAELHLQARHLPHAASAAAVLDVDGTRRIGTLASLPAGSTASRSLLFDEGGEVALEDALLDGAFTLVVVVPQGAALPVATNPERRRRPNGELQVQLELRFNP